MKVIIHDLGIEYNEKLYDYEIEYFYDFLTDIARC